MTSTETSTTPTADEIHFLKAARVLVGGMSGAARENAALGRPMLAASGDGPYIVSPGGTRYLDFFTGFGATILGHNDPGVRAAIERGLDLGLVHGPETIYQAELAGRLTELVPCAELIRYANSGSEATMVAIRAARAHTGRSKILKFEGHFHGLQEHVLYSTHPPAREPAPGQLLEPSIDSAGIPSAFAEFVVVAPWNDLAAVERAFATCDLAAVIMEPINYNAGCLVADRDYMLAVRDLTTRHGTVLIYDEVLSGFRTGVDCGQGYCGVTPDLALLGKAVANGVPLAVIAGGREVMETFGPLGPTAHSGTYSGHLFGVLAALATLEKLTGSGFYDGPDGLLACGKYFYDGLRGIFARHGIRCRVQGLGPRFSLYFGLDPDVEVKVYQDIVGHDFDMLKRFVRACFKQQVYFHSYDIVVGHHGFSAAHGHAELEESLERIDTACSHLAASRGGRDVKT